MEESEERLKTDFLIEAGQIYHSVNPSMARYLMNMGLRQGGDRFLKDFAQKKVCRFCGSFLSPDSHSVRFAPKVKQTKRIKNLAHKIDSGISLSKYEQFLASQHLQGTRQILTCKICKKKEKYLCLRRQGPLSKGTPTTESAGSTTQQQTPANSSEQQSNKKKKKKKKKKKEVNSAEILLSEIQEKSRGAPVTQKPTPKVMTPNSPQAMNRKARKANFFHSLQKRYEETSEEASSTGSGLKSFLMSV